MHAHSCENYPNEIIMELISYIKRLSKQYFSPTCCSVISGGIIFTENGIMNIMRNDGVLIMQLTAPAIAGLHTINQDSYVGFVSRTPYYIITHEHFFDTVEKYGLWKQVTTLSLFYLGLFYAREKVIGCKSKYEVIKHYIESVWLMPEKQRLQVSLFQYIPERVNISRSALHKILKELNNGGYIRTSRGKLIEVNRKLPEAF